MKQENLKLSEEIKLEKITAIQDAILDAMSAGYIQSGDCNIRRALYDCRDIVAVTTRQLEERLEEEIK